MIIHLDSDNPKSIEQKVRKLILDKLYYKVDLLPDIVNLGITNECILVDIIAFVEADCDINKVLRNAPNEQPNFKLDFKIKKNELLRVAVSFSNEVDAYNHYFNAIKEQQSEDLIYERVSFILSCDGPLYTKKLHEVMKKALARRVPETNDPIINRESLIENLAIQVRFIASNDTIKDAVDEAYYEYYMKKGLFTEEYLKEEFTRIAPLAQEEINAYKLALSLKNQSAQIGMVLTTVKQLLYLS